MDTVAWAQHFRSTVQSTKVNCFDELIQYSSLGEISYPNQFMMKVLWPDHDIQEQCASLNFNQPITKLIKWMNEMPSLWNELRYMTHCGIQQIIRSKKCSDIITTTLKIDGEKLQESDFKSYWNEIIRILSYQPNPQKEEDKVADLKYELNTIKCKENKAYSSTKNYLHKQIKMEQREIELKKTNKQATKENYLLNNQNAKNLSLSDFHMENQWKTQTIMNKLQNFKRKFNKLNFAYLFLRNYNIFELSELIRKNLQIECSRPTKFNYYNILTANRIYQENQKLVKGIVRQYKYKRRTRAMSADDNDNAIWIPNYKEKRSDEEYKIKNDRINILCEIKTAIVNNNQKEILRLSIDKRIKLIDTSELEKIGYFRAIQAMEKKEQEKNIKNTTEKKEKKETKNK